MADLKQKEMIFGLVEVVSRAKRGFNFRKKRDYYTVLSFYFQIFGFGTIFTLGAAGFAIGGNWGISFAGLFGCSGALVPLLMRFSLRFFTGDGLPKVTVTVHTLYMFQKLFYRSHSYWLVAFLFTGNDGYDMGAGTLLRGRHCTHHCPTR